VLGRPRPLTAIAEERVSFDLAMRWVGVDTGTRSRGMKTACPICGEDGAFRVYPDHGYCFAEQKYLGVIGLLAGAWELSREDAALQALERVGWVPADHAHLWADALREPKVARDDLGDALRIWCGANCADWNARQYEPVPARTLSQCLGLLSRVRTAEDCEVWLARCKQLMGLALNSRSLNDLTWVKLESTTATCPETGADGERL
jgi:hypothetical protein